VSSETGTGPDSPQHPAAPPNDAPAVRGGIRGVDFRNFDYPSSCLNGRIHVSKGEKRDDGVLSFKVVKTIYGDVTGDGSEAAVVQTMAPEGNSACNEVFVFAAPASGLKLLARLEPSDWGKGEEDNGSEFQVSDLRVINRQLAVSFLAGGFHACPAWTVTARFQWKGDRFLRVGLDRKPFKCQ